MLFGFTGYLLPWDDLSLGGDEGRDGHPRVRPRRRDWVTELSCAAARTSPATP